jgi:hypothetical protein
MCYDTLLDYNQFEFIVISVLGVCTSSLVLLNVPGSNPQRYFAPLKDLSSLNKKSRPLSAVGAAHTKHPGLLLSI